MQQSLSESALEEESCVASTARGGKPFRTRPFCSCCCCFSGEVAELGAWQCESCSGLELGLSCGELKDACCCCLGSAGGGAGAGGGGRCLICCCIPTRPFAIMSMCSGRGCCCCCCCRCSLGVGEGKGGRERGEGGGGGLLLLLLLMWNGGAVAECLSVR